MFNVCALWGNIYLVELLGKTKKYLKARFLAGLAFLVALNPICYFIRFTSFCFSAFILAVM